MHKYICNQLSKSDITSHHSRKNRELIAQGRLKPVIDKVYDRTEAEKANQRMEQNYNVRKLVLTGF